MAASSSFLYDSHAPSFLYVSHVSKIVDNLPWRLLSPSCTVPFPLHLPTRFPLPVPVSPAPITSTCASATRVRPPPLNVCHRLSNRPLQVKVHPTASAVRGSTSATCLPVTATTNTVVLPPHRPMPLPQHPIVTISPSIRRPCPAMLPSAATLVACASRAPLASPRARVRLLLCK